MNKPANLKTMNPDREGGFRCPNCGGPTAVIDSRSSPEGIRRRRVCHCGFRLTTYETRTALSESVLHGLLAKIRRASTEIAGLNAAVSSLLSQNTTTPTEGAAGGVSRVEAIGLRVLENYAIGLPYSQPYVAQDGEVYSGPSGIWP